jgi:large subunit ribosomal protein L4
MVNVSKWDEKGNKAGEVGLDDAIFAGRINTNLVGDAVIRQLSNRRRALANTKDRTEVRGGGRKPWRQKGTGRARAGSIRSPLWRGGAVAMGPSGAANYKLDMPRKARRASIRSILSDKVRHGQVSVLAPLTLEKPHTKTLVELISKMEFGESRVLFVLPQRDANFEKSVRNIPTAKALLCSNLNPHDLLHFEKLVIVEGALAKIAEVLG